MSNASDNHERSYNGGDRLSLKGQICTVRYVGTVADKPGTWLGVEWDDTSRGKHDGTHDGKVYFRCRSKSPKCASFLRPKQAWDAPRTFLQALQEKYMPDFREENFEKIYFSGKEAEEVGFAKFHQRQAQLKGIHVLVLDNMRVDRPADGSEELDAISRICSEITELDLSRNLFSSLDQVLDICIRLPKLRVLSLAANRFCVNSSAYALESVKTLDLSATLLESRQLQAIVGHTFPAVSELRCGSNELSGPFDFKSPPTVRQFDLSNNEFERISDLAQLWATSNKLDGLNLKHNNISAIGSDSAGPLRCPVKELDLSYNAITSFSFFNDISSAAFPRLAHLRVTGNPLYQFLISAEGKPLTASDGYMLTIARLPQLEYLNYAKVTDKERLNAETYYLGQIAMEISNAPSGKSDAVIAKHPRYKALCEEYGEPAAQTKTEKAAIDPNSFAARLVSVTFNLAPEVLLTGHPRSWTEEIPKAFSIYAVLGLVGKRLRTLPLDLRLVLETNERDPVGKKGAYSGLEWWDSEDEEESDGLGEWVKREVEMVAGTRTLGTYVEGHEAAVRVETRVCNG